PTGASPTAEPLRTREKGTGSCEESVKSPCSRTAGGARSSVEERRRNSVRQPGGSAVRDLVFVAVMVGFFALSVGLVRLCERIVGGAEVVAVDVPTSTEPTESAA